MLQDCQLLLSKRMQTGPDLRDSPVLEKPNTWAKEDDMKPWEVRRCWCHHTFTVPSSAEMPGENPGVSRGSAGKVPEERQPSSKAFRFGTHNSTVLLEKLHSSFCQHWGGSKPSWAKRNLPPRRPRALERQGTLGILWQRGRASTVQECHWRGSHSPNWIQDNLSFNVSLNYVNWGEGIPSYRQHLILPWLILIWLTVSHTGETF